MLKKLADSDGVSMSDVVRMLIRRAYRTRFERRTVDSDRDVKPEKAIKPEHSPEGEYSPRTGSPPGGEPETPEDLRRPVLRRPGAASHADRAQLIRALQAMIEHGTSDPELSLRAFDHDGGRFPRGSAPLVAKLLKLDPAELTYSNVAAALAAYLKNNPNKK